jgi:hypothetical protein
MAQNGLLLRLRQHYYHFYPRVIQTPKGAVKSHHQMTRAPIWDAAHPTRRQPLQARMASLPCRSVHDSWRASSTPDVRHDYTNPRTIKNSCGWRFLRCNTTTGQVLVESRKPYLLILSKSRPLVSFGPLHAHFLTSCNGPFTSLINCR